MGKQTAVVVRQYNKDNPAEALDVIQKDIPQPKEGYILLTKMHIYYYHAFSRHALSRIINLGSDACPGQALVRVLYRPINPSDIFCVQGTYGGWHPKLPAVPGLEGLFRTLAPCAILAIALHHEIRGGQ